jgi:hypothetical protein
MIYDNYIVKNVNGSLFQDLIVGLELVDQKSKH